MLVLLVTNMLVLAFNIHSVKAQGTITINADGSITPPTAPIQRNGNTYTLTANIAASADGIVIERDNIVLDGAGYTVTGNGNANGIRLISMSGVTVRNIMIRNFVIGIELYDSSDNSLSGDTVTAITNIGISLYSSSSNTLSSNTVTARYEDIFLWPASDNNALSGNTLTNSGSGIFLIGSSNNALSGNTVTNDHDGLVLNSSSGNTLSGNNIANNAGSGIFLENSSSNNFIFHNSFVSNPTQAAMDGLANIWDNGYPSGGNYWSDYVAKYPNAAEIDNSGLWNTPYVIQQQANNKDNYPLMRPWGSPPLTSSSTFVSCSPNPASVGSSVTCTATVSGSNPIGKVTWSTNSSTGSFSSPNPSSLSSGSCSTTYTDTNAGSVTIKATYIGDSNNEPSSGITTLTVIGSVTTNWEPSRDSYNFANVGGVGASDGWCYGMSSTAVLYFEQYFQTPFANPRAPFFPSQSSKAQSTYDLQPSASGELNNVALAIMVHQAYDLQSSAVTNLAALASLNEAHEFNELVANLKTGQPVALNLYPSVLSILHGCHDVVAWAYGELPDGTYKISIYDPDWPQDLLLNGVDYGKFAYYNPTGQTFTYNRGDAVFTAFRVIIPEPIQSSWFSWSAPSGPYTSGTIISNDQMKNWLQYSVPNYYIIVADKSVTVGVNGLEDYFTTPGNSQTFVCGIPGSSGIEEGNMQVYAVLGGTVPKVHDPGSSQSTIFISRVVDDSGQIVGYSYFLDASTTQGYLDYTVTPSNSGLSISAGDNALNATVTCFTATQQGYSVSEVLTTQIGAGQSFNPASPCAASFTASKTVVGQGYPVPINGTITNVGNNPENVTLTLSANTTTLDSETLLNLLNGTSVNLVYGVNTSSLAYGNYTLSAYCEPNGINEAANNFTYTGSLTVTIPGDLTGDFKVGLPDLVALAQAYGSKPGDANWNPNTDINGNGIVDLADLVILAQYYGQHYP